jgi:hypothetical protein
MVTKEVGEAIGGLKKLVPTGTCVLIEGLLAETPEGTKQVGAHDTAGHDRHVMVQYQQQLRSSWQTTHAIA